MRGCCTIGEPIIKDKAIVEFICIGYIGFIEVKDLTFFGRVKRNFVGLFDSEHNMFIVVPFANLLPLVRLFSPLPLKPLPFPAIPIIPQLPFAL